MSGRILPFQRRSPSRDWSAEELVEFYRVEEALFRSGLAVNSDRGLTDEGEPWFVFFRPDDEEVVVHFARIGGRYLLSAPAYGADVTGDDFTLLVRGLLERQPPLQSTSRANLIIHPASLLLVLVASALLKSGHSAHAAESFSAAERAPLVRSPPSASGVTVSSSALLTADEQSLVLNAVAIVGAAADAAPISTPSAQAFSDSTADFRFHQPAFPELAASIDPLSEPSVAPAYSISPMTGGAAMLSPEVHPDATFAIPAQPGSFAPVSAGAPAFMAVSPEPQIFGSSPISTAANPQVTMGAADSPHGAAVLMVDSLGANVPVMHAAQVPDEFVTIVDKGTHNPGGSAARAFGAAGLSSAEPEVHASAHLGQPAGALMEQEASASQAIQPSSATAGGVSAASAVSATPDSSAVVAAPVAASVASMSPQAAELQIALADIKQFVGDVLHPKVLLTTNSVIVYDADAVDHSGPLVTSLTFDFSDGTSISLVGVPAELAHLHVLSA